MLPTGPPSQRNLVKKELGKITASGKLPPPGSRIIVELGCTEAWGHHTINKFPCITATRGSQCNYWVADLGRQVTPP